MRLAIGWAQPVAGERLTDAIRIAEQRMNADRRRYDFRSAASAEPRELPSRAPVARIRTDQAVAVRDVAGWVEQRESSAPSDDIARPMVDPDGTRRGQRW